MASEIDFQQKFADLQHLIDLEYYPQAWRVIAEIEASIEQGAWRTLTVELKKQLETLSANLEERTKHQRSEILIKLDQILSSDPHDLSNPSDIFQGEELLRLLAQLDYKGKQDPLIENYASRLSKLNRIRLATLEFLEMRAEVERLWDEGRQLQTTGAGVDEVRERFKRAVNVSREILRYGNTDTRAEDLHRSAQTILDNLIHREKMSVELNDQYYELGATPHVNTLKRLANQDDDEMIVITDWNESARWMSVGEARKILETRLRRNADTPSRSYPQDRKQAWGKWHLSSS